MQAILHDDSVMARLIVEHQIGTEGREDLIADLAALAATLLRCIEPEYRELFMRTVREQCDLNERERGEMRNRAGMDAEV